MLFDHGQGCGSWRCVFIATKSQAQFWALTVCITMTFSTIWKRVVWVLRDPIVAGMTYGNHHYWRREYYTHEQLLASYWNVNITALQETARIQSSGLYHALGWLKCHGEKLLRLARLLLAENRSQYYCCDQHRQQRALIYHLTKRSLLFARSSLWRIRRKRHDWNGYRQLCLQPGYTRSKVHTPLHVGFLSHLWPRDELWDQTGFFV